MSSDGNWHLLYYSLGDSTSLSCCTQPRGFNSRWLIQEITFSRPPHPTTPLSQSGDALSVCSAVPRPSAREYWQPGAPLPARACWWLAQGSSKELGAPLQTWKGHDSHFAETCPKPSRVVGTMLPESASPYTWPCAQCLTEPLLFPAALGCVQEASLCLPKNKQTKMQKKKPNPTSPPSHPQPQLVKRKGVKTKWVKWKCFPLSSVL